LFYIKDTPRSGKLFLGINLTELVLSIMTQNSINRNWSINQIVTKIYKKIKNNKTILTKSIYIILKNNNFNLIKSTIKPGLIDTNKAKRLV
jgi:hypothetical protein